MDDTARSYTVKQGDRYHRFPGANQNEKPKTITKKQSPNQPTDLDVSHTHKQMHTEQS